MKILIVEDNQGDYEYICALLEEDIKFSYEIIRGETLRDAKTIASAETPDLILLDLHLPDSFGIETAEKMIQSVPHIPIIVLTGLKNEETGLEAIKKGAQDFISKNDLDTKYLVKSIEYSLERKKYIEDFKKTQQEIFYLLDYSSDGVCVVDNDLNIKDLNSAFAKLFRLDEAKSLSSKIAEALSDFSESGLKEKINSVLANRKHQLFNYQVNVLTETWYEIRLDPYPSGIIISVRDISDMMAEHKELNLLNASLQKSTDSTISLLAQLVELKEPYTAGHQERVALLSDQIAGKLKLTSLQKKALNLAAKIHDIGKTAIPSEILVKPSTLSENEMKLVRYHVESGYNLINKIDTEINLSDIVLQHHERIDGSGYPNGITGKEMLLEAKILAVADVVDAMMSHRPYRSAFTSTQVIQELDKNKSILYDKEVVMACIDILKKKSMEEGN